MFTGIVEALGFVRAIEIVGGNKEFSIESPFTAELKVDQSVAHNGACLTVTKIDGKIYSVTAIEESLNKTNLNALKLGSQVNLERCMLMNGRLDGHIVQGHVDQTGVCEKIEDLDGSHIITFSYDSSLGNVTVEKGSICINGVSLTVVNSEKDNFSVAIIPYTFEHTNFKFLKVGDAVNLEFDVIGKYVKRLLENK